MLRDNERCDLRGSRHWPNAAKGDFLCYCRSVGLQGASALHRAHVRWPMSVKAYGPNQLFIPRLGVGEGPSEIEYVRKWYKARAQWIDKYITNFVERPGMVRSGNEPTTLNPQTFGPFRVQRQGRSSTECVVFARQCSNLEPLGLAMTSSPTVPPTSKANAQTAPIFTAPSPPSVPYVGWSPSGSPQSNPTKVTRLCP